MRPGMTMRRDQARGCTLALLLTLGAFWVACVPPVQAFEAPTITGDNPADLIAAVARILLDRIAAHRSQYASDPQSLDKLVRTVILPEFDSELAARRVLARHWDAATPEQRILFTDAFYHLLLHNLGADLVHFSLDRLQVLPYRGDRGATYATVETLVRRRDGELLHVNYSLHRSNQGWKVYDIAFEGISYLTSFRGDFAEEIEQKGLYELISRLQVTYGGGTSG
jgi:phospholipid transport system substrate-binding protein